MSKIVVVVLMQKKIIVSLEDSHWFAELNLNFLFPCEHAAVAGLFLKKGNSRQWPADCTPCIQSFSP